MSKQLLTIYFLAAIAAATILVHTDSITYGETARQQTPPIIIRITEVETGNSSVVADPGDQVTMRITAENIQPVAGIQFTLTWDPAAVAVPSADSVTMGPQVPFGLPPRLGDGSMTMVFASASAWNIQSLHIVDIVFTLSEAHGSSTMLRFEKLIVANAASPVPRAIENVVAEGARITVRPSQTDPSATPAATQEPSPTPDVAVSLTVTPTATLTAVPTFAAPPRALVTGTPTPTPPASPFTRTPAPTQTSTLTPGQSTVIAATSTPPPAPAPRPPNVSTPTPSPTATRTPVVATSVPPTRTPTTTPVPTIAQQQAPQRTNTATTIPIRPPEPTATVARVISTATVVSTPTPTVVPVTAAPAPTVQPPSPTTTPVPSPTVSRVLAAASTPAITPIGSAVINTAVPEVSPTPTPSGGMCSSPGSGVDGAWLVMGLLLPSWPLRRRLLGLLGNRRRWL